MKNKRYLTYIDDNIDNILSKYLLDYCENEEYLEYKEIAFDTGTNYELLLEEEKIRKAQIVVIDSKLFENQTVVNGKFSGEEFKMILRKVFPFIEVIVITQNEVIMPIQVVQKFKTSRESESKEGKNYYDGNLLPLLTEARATIASFEGISLKLENSPAIDEVMLQKILNSANGDSIYDELKKDDIDKLISLFREMKGGLK